jgi:hypothetical protein
MGQQLSISLGVVMGASLLTLISVWHGDSASHLQPRDFPPAFLTIGLMTLISVCSFVRLRPDEGDALRGR